MWQTGKTWVFLLPSLALVFSNGAYGLTCNFCQSLNDYNSCLKNFSVECTEALVNVTHMLLAPYNPSLKEVPPGQDSQCFQVNFTVNGMTNYQMGCTFAGSHICEGWTVPSQCRIVNGIAKPNPPSSIVPSSTPSVSPIPSTTPGVGTTSKKSTPSIGTSSRAIPSTTPAAGSKKSTPSIGTSSRATPLKNNGTTTAVHPTLYTEGFSSTPRPETSRANAVTLRFDLLLLLSVVLLWCQNL